MEKKHVHVIGKYKANFCMESEKPKTHLEKEHMNNLKIHEKRKVKKNQTCAWRVTTKTCLESEYI